MQTALTNVRFCIKKMQTAKMKGCKLHQINDRTIEPDKKEKSQKKQQSSGDIPINNGLS